MNKGSNSLKNGQILPIDNPIPLFPDSNMYVNLKKVLEQILKLSIGNDADGHMDGRTDRHRRVLKELHRQIG